MTLAQQRYRSLRSFLPGMIARPLAGNNPAMRAVRFGASNPVIAGSMIAGVIGGGLLGFSHSGDDSGETAGNTTAGAAIGLGVGATAGAGLTMLAKASIVRKIGPREQFKPFVELGGPIGYGVDKAKSYFASLKFSEGMNTARASGRGYIGARLTNSEAFVKTFVSRRLVMGGAGAVFGTAIGAKFGSPGIGALVGAGVGVAGSQMYRSVKAWEALAGHQADLHEGMGIRIAGAARKSTRNAIALGAITLVAGAAGLSMSGTPPETTVGAVPDGMGGYDYGDVTSVRDRLDMMGASGDIVFGLNRKKHG
jgi:hypothetical protein